MRAALASDARAWLGLVEEALAEGGDARVAEWLYLALARAQTPEVLLAVARVAFQAEHPDLGQAALDRACDEADVLGPDAAFEGMLGALQVQFADPISGRAHLRRAIALASGSGPLLALVDAHLPQLDAELVAEALQRHKELVAIEGPSTVGCLALCDLYRRLGWSDQAAALRVAWDAVAGLDDLVALSAFARRTEHRTCLESATRALEAALTGEAADDWRRWDALAVQWQALGDLEAARRCGRRALIAAKVGGDACPEEALDALSAWARRTGAVQPYVEALRGWWPTATEPAALAARANELMALDPTQADLAFLLRQRAYRRPGGRPLRPAILAALIAEGHPRAEGLLGSLWSRASDFAAQLELIEIGHRLRPDWAVAVAHRLFKSPQPLERLLEAVPRLPEPEATRQWEQVVARATTPRTLRAALELALQADRPELALLYDRWQRRLRRKAGAAAAAVDPASSTSA